MRKKLLKDIEKSGIRYLNFAECGSFQTNLLISGFLIVVFVNKGCLRSRIKVL